MRRGVPRGELRRLEIAEDGAHAAAVVGAVSNRDDPLRARCAPSAIRLHYMNVCPIRSPLSTHSASSQVRRKPSIRCDACSHKKRQVSSPEGTVVVHRKLHRTSALPRSRQFADGSTEHSGKMALVSEPACRCDLRHWGVVSQKQRFRHFDPSNCQPTMWRHAGRLLECPLEVTWRKTTCSSQHVY